MLNADWLGAPSLRTFRTIGARGIKTWHAFGVPSHFLYFIQLLTNLKQHGLQNTVYTVSPVPHQKLKAQMV